MKHEVCGARTVMSPSQSSLSLGAGMTFHYGSEEIIKIVKLQRAIRRRIRRRNAVDNYFSKLPAGMSPEDVVNVKVGKLWLLESLDTVH